MKKAFLLIALLLISFWCINVKADDDTTLPIATDPENAEIEVKKEEKVEEVEIVKQEEIVVEEVKPETKEEVVPETKVEKQEEEKNPEEVKIEKQEEKKEEPAPVVKAAKAPTPVLTVNYIDTRVEGLDPLTKTYTLGTAKNDNLIYRYLNLSAANTDLYQVDDTKYYYVFDGWYTSDGTKIPAGKNNAIEIDDVKIYYFSNSYKNWLYYDSTGVTEGKEITLYGKWSSKIYKATVDINVFDDKAFSNTQVTYFEQWKKELPVSFSGGEGGTTTLMLDQLFKNNDFYTAFDNSTLRVGVKNSASYYVFKGWYDSEGNEIIDGYTNDVIKSVRVFDKGSQRKSLEITFKDALNANVSEDVLVKIYVKWEEFTTALFEHEYIDEVSTGSGNWTNSNTGGTTEYSHKFKDPSIATPKTHYKFLYWKHDDINDNQVDPTKEYKDGDVFNYSLSNKPSEWSGKVTTYAYWQPDVTLDLYDGDGKFISSESSFESVSINYDTERVGYKFLGWFDKDGNKVDETTFYPNEMGTKPETKQITLYAKYELILIDVSVAKEWDDENDQDGLRPDSINVTLSNGTTVTLNEENKWTATVKDVPEYEDGEKVNYTWTEETPEGYELTDTVLDEENNLTTLINTHIPKLIEITVTKVWADDENESGKRPESVTIALVVDEEEIETVELNEENDWTHTFKELPAYSNKKEVTYEVRELEVPEGYEVSYEETEDGYIIHNVLGQGEGEPDKPNNNPQTGDNIGLYVIGLMTSLSGLVVCVKKYNFE